MPDSPVFSSDYLAIGRVFWYKTQLIFKPAHRLFFDPGS
jgi:hypothetical protein